ncbi:MAG: hypothetical protein U0838_06655 [Chloroflexota bacterium]
MEAVGVDDRHELGGLWGVRRCARSSPWARKCELSAKEAGSLGRARGSMPPDIFMPSAWPDSCSMIG